MLKMAQISHVTHQISLELVKECKNNYQNFIQGVSTELQGVSKFFISFKILKMAQISHVTHQISLELVQDFKNNDQNFIQGVSTELQGVSKGIGCFTYRSFAV